MISGSFAGKDLQLQASYARSSPCNMAECEFDVCQRSWTCVRGAEEEGERRKRVNARAGGCRELAVLCCVGVLKSHTRIPHHTNYTTPYTHPTQQTTPATPQTTPAAISFIDYVNVFKNAINIASRPCMGLLYGVYCVSLLACVYVARR